MEKARRRIVGLCWLLTFSFSASIAHAECMDILLKLVDDSGQVEGDSGREITLFLNCHEGNFLYPAATTINVFEWEHGQFCHQWKSCGNLRQWEVSGGVAVSIFWGDIVSKIFETSTYGTVDDNLQTIFTKGKIKTTQDETSIQVSLGFKYGDIRHFCSDLSPKFCW